MLKIDQFTKRYSRYYIYLEPVVTDPLIRGYFSLVASLLLIAFFLIFALSPTINTIITLQKKIAEQKKVVTNLTQKIADIVTAQQNYSQVETKLPLLYTALPATPAPQTIISQTTDLASASGLVVNSLQFQNIPLSPDAIIAALNDDKDSLTVHLTFNLTGDSDKIIDFLRKLELQPRLMRLENISISSDPKTALKSFSINAEGFYFPDESL